MKSLSHCLLIAVLMLAGCSSSKPPLLPQTKPPLPVVMTVKPVPLTVPISDSWDALAVLYLELLGRYRQCEVRREAVN